MGYKLADGSDSNLYEAGDTFTLTENGRKSDFKAGYLVKLIVPDPALAAFELPLFPPVSSIEDWSIMTPTPSTVRNVIKRNRDMEAMEAGIIKRYEDNVNYVTQTLEASQQQPCVPIQFIWCEGQLHPASDAINIAFTGDSCEQIGAVLYVRSEK